MFVCRFNELAPTLSQGNIGTQFFIVTNNEIVINGNGIFQYRQIQNEYHFGRNSKKNMYVFHILFIRLVKDMHKMHRFCKMCTNFRLEPNVRRKFVELLAIRQDVERSERVAGDTHCKMVQEILSGERNVECANALLKPQQQQQQQNIVIIN